MTDKPKWMPEPAEFACIGGVGQDVFTADQLAAVRREALEEAAKLADDMDYGTELAPAIRALKEQP